MSYRPTTALAQAVSFDNSTMHVQLTDGRTVSVPLLWFPRLLAAGAAGTSSYWRRRARPALG